MKYGIDVSHHNGNINWDKVKTSDIAFVIMKAMYEGSKKPDEMFEANYTGATDAGFNVGVYNFIGKNSALEPKKDAELFLKILNGRKLDFGIWIDVEGDELKSLGKDKIEQVIIEESEIFTNAGYNVGIYCNLDWYKNIITDKVKELFNGKFWIARYPKNDKGQPVNSLSPKNICPESIGWQYSSKGKVDGISGNVDLDMFWEELHSEVENIVVSDEFFSRTVIVKQANNWLGLNEADGSYKIIIDEYNKQNPLPSGYKLKDTDSWCAAFITAVFNAVGYGSIFPCECSCERMINKAIEMGIWVEQDSYVPGIGDGIMYDWQDEGTGECSGRADHVGIVTYVNIASNYIEVIEGNYSDAVKKRTINIDGRYIRGYVVPKFTTLDVDGLVSDYCTKCKDVNTIAYEVIAGKWGSNKTSPTREQLLTEAGYNYSDVQNMVNEILNVPKKVVNTSITAGAKAQKIDISLAGDYNTVTDLHLRDGAGTDKKSLVIIPKGTVVKNYGYYSVADDVKWLLIKFILNGVGYTGFSSIKYLERR